MRTRSAIRPPKHFAERLRRMIYLVLLAAIGGLYLVYRIDRNAQPVFLRIVQYECRQFAFNTFSEVADENTALVPEYFRDLYTIQYTPEGRIAAVTVNAYAINRLQSTLSNEVTKRLAKAEERPLQVPLGTLTGVQAFLGRGPELPLHIAPTSYVDADVYNKLESTGINQTRLVLYVRFTMTMGVVMAGYGTTVEVTDEQYLGEVLLLGQIPDSYLNSGG